MQPAGQNEVSWRHFCEWQQTATWWGPPQMKSNQIWVIYDLRWRISEFISTVELFSNITIKFPPKKELTLWPTIYFPYSKNVNQISREAWQCWSYICIVYKRQKRWNESASFANFGFISQGKYIKERQVFPYAIFFLPSFFIIQLVHEVTLTRNCFYNRR